MTTDTPNFTTEWRMAPEEKAAWVKALRSGDYQQGHTYLCSSNGEYCCLGVYGRTRGISRSDLTRCYLYELNDRRDGLPKDVQEHLAYRNDTLQESFEQIANWIEENL